MRPVIFILLLQTSVALAQNFWTTTPAAPTVAGSPTTDIAISPVIGTIYVSTIASGIFRSDDEGAQWTQETADTAIFCIASRNDGMIVAGGIGCVYFSQDDGFTWTRKNISSQWSVRDIAFDSDGGIYVTTADVEDVGGTGYFRGDGVFYSGDHGNTWEQRNNGITGSKAAWNIEITSEDELIVAMNDDRSGLAVGGVYFSTDKGLNWTKINFKVTDGSFQYENVVVTNVRHVLAGEQDSIYIVLDAIYTNFGLQFNAKLAMSDLKQSGVWQPFSIADSVPDPVLQPTFSRLFMQSDGSLFGSIELGVYKSDDAAQAWEKKISGITPVRYSGNQPRFNFCRFAEYHDGRVFMIQPGDTSVYKADSTRLETGVLPVESFVHNLRVYPNPVQQQLTVEFTLEKRAAVELHLYDAKGALLRTLYQSNELQPQHHRIPVVITEKPGAYFIHLKSATGDAVMAVTKM